MRAARPPVALALAAALVGGCAASPAPVTAPVAPHPAPASEASSPSGAPKEALSWAELGPAAFARAKAESRLLVIDGSAEWCHWCHVMEATSYHDPDVRKVLDAHFVAVKVDVDTRPDFEERYVAWGWPATVLMTPDGEEIGKYKGYLAPEAFVEILKTAVASQRTGAGSGAKVARAEPARALAPAELDEARGRVQRQLDDYYDKKMGSWGVPQKALLGWDDQWTLRRAKADPGERQKALFTLDQEVGLVDPVWGGVCQYSTDGDWKHGHHEKLMTVQAAAITSYAEAYALTRDPRYLALAQKVRGFVDAFMRAPEGGFFTTMDADLNAHEKGKTYVKGDDYYARTDAERRALGIPRVDDHVYGRENGLAIAAYVTLAQAAGDDTALAAARKAAARLFDTHALDDGSIAHAGKKDESSKVRYLADNAAYGWGLMRLYEATGDAAALATASAIADFLLGTLQDPVGGGFWSSTPDPNAVGVFAVRRKPFEDDVMAIRFLSRFARVHDTPRVREAIARALYVVTRPEAVEDRGRMVGDLLLAIDEAAVDPAGARANPSTRPGNPSPPHPASPSPMGP